MRRELRRAQRRNAARSGAPGGSERRSEEIKKFERANVVCAFSAGRTVDRSEPEHRGGWPGHD
jgi:hypothetical protein